MSDFQLLPAIDIKDGKCVRLLQGRFDQTTEYNDDPVTQAELFEAAGAKYLHVVDLDGALEGNPRNFEIIKNIIFGVRCKVEVSGGIRTEADIERFLSINPWQIILGSIAVFDLSFIEKVIKKYGNDKFSISLDSKDGFAASRGWVEKSEVKVVDLAKQLDDIGIQRYIFTDISRDGMLNGANLEKTMELKNIVKGQVIASGGVKSLDEIKMIKAAGINGVIVGKAIYEGKVDLKEAIGV